MNKQQWSETVADAVYNANVMNQTVIVYNTQNGKFNYQSSLAPLCDCEVIVDNDCSDESFGMSVENGVDTEYNTTEEEFAQGLLDGLFNDYWILTQEKIEDFLN